MGAPTKIATCCYWGTRAVLVLKGKLRHELSCASCGAPLHEMKRLRKDRVEDHETPRPVPSKPRRRKKPARRRKGLWEKFVEEAFDAVEDIFD